MTPERGVYEDDPIPEDWDEYDDERNWDWSYD